MDVGEGCWKKHHLLKAEIKGIKSLTLSSAVHPPHPGVSPFLSHLLPWLTIILRLLHIKGQHAQWTAFLGDGGPLAGCQALYGHTVWAHFNWSKKSRTSFRKSPHDALLMSWCLKSLLSKSYCIPCCKSDTKHIYFCTNCAHLMRNSQIPPAFCMFAECDSTL